MLPPLYPRPGGDTAIRETDNDAAAARLSAVQKGYLNDPYIKYFVPRAHLLSPRPPLINIGTYVRTTALDALVYQWLQISEVVGQKCQIVSLGAGSDTRFWRIAAGPLDKHLATYVELDLPENTTKKAMAIKKNKELMARLGPDPRQVSIGQGGTSLHSERYHLLPVDLRKDPSETLEPLISDVNANRLAILDLSLPTLLIFECVLVYMSPESSTRLLQWFVDQSRCNPRGTLGCIVYEMFGLNDSFGRVMVDNLKERGITLLGAVPYPTIESLPDRFLQTGFLAARAVTLKEIRKGYIEAKELERISTLEFLDETEELDLVLAHYAISWGLFLAASDQHKDWGQWGLSYKAED